MAKQKIRICRRIVLLIFMAVVSAVASAAQAADDDPRVLPDRLDFLIQNRADSDTAGIAALLKQSLASYGKLKGYESLFRKKEGSNGKLQPEEQIYLKFEKPFKIFMGWQNTQKQGLQVVYERGRHDGKLAVHQPGLFFGLASVVFLDQSSPWVREGSASYNIEDAGIGNFLFEFTRCVITAAEKRNLRVTRSGQDRRFAVTFLNSTPGSEFFAYRVVVSFDPVSGLPTRMALFDWKQRPTGIYAYNDLVIDPAPDSRKFLAEINRQLYRVYDSKPAAGGLQNPRSFARGR